jgi:hypothetical protein
MRPYVVDRRFVVYRSQHRAAATASGARMELNRPAATDYSSFITTHARPTREKGRKVAATKDSCALLLY